MLVFFFFNDPATHEFYTYCTSLSRPDALPISDSSRGGHRGQATTAGRGILRCLLAMVRSRAPRRSPGCLAVARIARRGVAEWTRSEEHTSELQSLMRISYAVFCLNKKQHNYIHTPKPTNNKNRTTITTN